MSFQTRIALFVLILAVSVACLAVNALLYRRLSAVDLAEVVIYSGLAWLLGGYIDRMRVLSHKDPLTDAYNRRYVLRQYGNWTKRTRKGQRPLVLLLVDIDDFKPINDKYGHKQGDVVLQAVASALKKQAQPGGMVARWGGDEFLVMVPSAENPEALLDRMETAIERASQTLGIAVTISAGAACYPAQGTQLDELIKVADKHMYERKGSKKRESPISRIVNQ